MRTDYELLQSVWIGHRVVRLSNGKLTSYDRFSRSWCRLGLCCSCLFDLLWWVALGGMWKLLKTFLQRLQYRYNFLHLPVNYVVLWEYWCQGNWSVSPCIVASMDLVISLPLKPGSSSMVDVKLGPATKNVTVTGSCPANNTKPEVSADHWYPWITSNIDIFKTIHQDIFDFISDFL